MVSFFAFVFYLFAWFIAERIMKLRLLHNVSVAMFKQGVSDKVGWSCIVKNSDEIDYYYAKDRSVDYIATRLVRQVANR